MQINLAFRPRSSAGVHISVVISTALAVVHAAIEHVRPRQDALTGEDAPRKPVQHLGCDLALQDDGRSVPTTSNQQEQRDTII